MHLDGPRAPRRWPSWRLLAGLASIAGCASYGTSARVDDAGSDAPVVVPPSDAAADAAPASDAQPDAGDGCVVLALTSAQGRLPTLQGRASITAGALRLLAPDSFAFNQSGTATWVFGASTKVSGSYDLQVGSPVSSGYGDGTAIGFYPGTPGDPLPGLLGLRTGAGAGAFYDSQQSSMSAAKRNTFGLGTFNTTRTIPSSVALPVPPFARKVTFEVTPTKVTVDGTSITTAIGPVAALVLGAACTSENPQGFAIANFSASACP